MTDDEIFGEFGKLVSWIPGRGFGFIRPDHNGSDVFAHVSRFKNAESEIKKGVKVAFERAKGRDGRDLATNITIQLLVPSNE